MKRFVKGQSTIYAPVTAQITGAGNIDVFEAMCLIEDTTPGRLASRILMAAIERESHDHGIRAVLEARNRYLESLREVRQ